MFEVLAWICFAVTGGWLTVIDVKTHKLPNRIIYPWLLVALMLFALAAVTTWQWASLATAVAGAILHFAIYVVLWLLSRRAVGMGDVKLAAVLGIYLGWCGLLLVPVAVLAAFVLGTLYSLAGMAVGKLTLKSRIPFGPMMIAGTALTNAAMVLLRVS